MSATKLAIHAPAGVGVSVPRPDGIPKATGTFAYVGDLHADGMLWAATRRATVARGRITRLDTGPALAVPGVAAVITQADVPAAPRQGQSVTDQPVLADGEIRHWGEAIAVVAAGDPETARRAAAAITVEVEPLEALTDPETAVARGETYGHVRVRRGDPEAHGDVVVEGVYETATQDQAALGTEAGLAVPDGAGGVDVYGPTQWVHVDHEQLVACLGLGPDQVRVHPVGLGGAFGSREDLTVQTHLAMLALRTHRPVKAVYDRTESFAAHVKRHAARMWYRHEADRDGHLVRVEARIVLDGGAYHMTTKPVLANATYFAVGAYRCPNTFVDGWAARTNNPPAGAMRGFGANQVVFAAEAQMDRLARAVGLDPVEVRLRNALGPGDALATTGQVIEGPLPSAEALRTVAALPLPDDAAGPGRPRDDPRHRPGGTGLTTPPSAVVRGVGYALGIKNVAFSEGFDDSAQARVELTPDGAVVHTAAIEVGQGLVTVLAQIARSALGLESVEVAFAHTGEIGSAGSTSASRQTPMAGNAVLRAATALRDRVLARFDGDDLTDAGVWRDGRLVASLADMCADGPVAEDVTYRHAPTEPGDADGQGRIHVDFSVAAHRAVVDVDPELGLAHVLRVDAVQDVGHALNPAQVVGQIEGGTAQGLGFAVMEQVVLDDGVVRNPTFTDYLLPTALDMPDVESVLIEEPSPWGPFGAKGFAELPTIAAAPAIVAALRDATGKDLARLPVVPADIAMPSAVSPDDP